MRRLDDTDYAEFALVAARRMCRTAYLMCGDWHRAEDATQDALVKVYRRWRHLKRGGGLASYAHRVVMSAVLDHVGRKRRKIVDGMGDVDLAAPEEMTAVDNRVVVVQALSMLPPGPRACVVLRHYADFTVEQTAEVLGTGVGSVRSQAASGLAQLRRLLAIPERSDIEWLLASAVDDDDRSYNVVTGELMQRGRRSVRRRRIAVVASVALVALAVAAVATPAASAARGAGAAPCTRDAAAEDIGNGRYFHLRPTVSS
ncbi:hypothetical protein GCM10029976_042670 [Kribbella albertanoniae]|uniref:SigE family RNA polymerase sigma factor n=1 Tax=Kribbella albertanoniae TaxID=1266829 RepID=A0A4R4QF03_9ACTN|nr:SigE family RNA polymerase sigma factor [Kribbella albertanoniae]TDC34050.1 SigE family RNA polymerase sigma factor [Kribbella albertanoniae]